MNAFIYPKLKLQPLRELIGHSFRILPNQFRIIFANLNYVIISFFYFGLFKKNRYVFQNINVFLFIVQFYENSLKNYVRFIH